MKKKIIAELLKHLKTRKHRRPDWDYKVGKKTKKGYAFNNDWGASQQEGFLTAVDLIRKMKA